MTKRNFLKEIKVEEEKTLFFILCTYKAYDDGTNNGTYIQINSQEREKIKKARVK